MIPVHPMYLLRSMLAGVAAGLGMMFVPELGPPPPAGRALPSDRAPDADAHPRSLPRLPEQRRDPAW
ncbi:hypothetical protein [Kitasatospora sp. NPDC059571]|uniref:hypothetical protein n=1 Tax=Kitasatospora sp. NPDC059571 TaxID=3346871 RepID=UPI00368996FD